MEHVNQLSGENVTPRGKSTRKRRFTKLTGASLAGLPNAADLKQSVGDVAFIHFVIPVTDGVGTVAECGEVFDFVTNLDARSRTLGIGNTSKVDFSDGAAEVVLRLNAAVEPGNHGAAAADAFSKLNEFLAAAPALRLVRAGRSAMWKAKINGTTIADGRY